MAERRNSSDPPAGAPRGRSGSRAAEPQTVAASITDLRDWRLRRQLRDLDAIFGPPIDGDPMRGVSTQQPPCTGTCECWGAPLGGWST